MTIKQFFYICTLNVYIFRLILNKCNTEVDISIVDRITALLHPPPICVIEKNRFAGQQPAPLNSASSTDSKISFKLTSPFLSAKIR